MELLASCVEVGVEGSVVNAVEEMLLKVGRGHIVGCVSERKHILKHTAGCARCGNELYDLVARIVGIIFPSL